MIFQHLFNETFEKGKLGVKQRENSRIPSLGPSSGKWDRIDHKIKPHALQKQRSENHKLPNSPQKNWKLGPWQPRFACFSFFCWKFCIYRTSKTGKIRKSRPGNDFQISTDRDFHGTRRLKSQIWNAGTFFLRGPGITRSDLFQDFPCKSSRALK